MSVSLRKQRDKPSENRIFKKENKYGNLSIIHHSQRLPKGTFRTAWGGNLSGFGYFGFVSLQQSSVCSLQYMQTSILTTWFLGVFFTEIVTLTCSQSNGSTHSIGFTQDLSLCSR